MTNARVEEEVRSDAAVVSVAGELDMYTAPEFEEQLNVALAGGARRLVVDLSACEFLDSSALAVLLAIRQRLNGKGPIRLVGVHRDIAKIFQIAGLNRLFLFERSASAPHPLGGR